MNLLKKNYFEEVLSLIIFAVCFVLAIFFPAEGHLQQFSSIFFFLFLLPVLYIKFVLKKDLSRFGFNLENRRSGIAWGLSMFLVSFLATFILIKYSGFKEAYAGMLFENENITTNFWAFLFYELVLVNFIFFLQEFFFKGFFLSILSYRLGAISFIVQGVVFILFLAIFSLEWRMAPIIILAFTGGIVAYKSKSFLYAYLMGLAFMIILDAYIIYSLK